ncbi:MAG: carboxypeptidase regulatory-like domain-containing protein [Isosphaeraceae bacterium]
MRPAFELAGFAGLSASLLLLAGCSGNAPAKLAAPTTTTTTAAEPAHAAPAARPALKRPAAFDTIKAESDKGVIIGRVIYQGTPPKPKAINFGADKVCGDLHKGQSAFYENLVVNPDSTIKWALVSIRGKVPGKFTPPAKPVEIDQQGCVFTPHVLAMMAGQEIEYKNSDPLSHNIRTNARRNPPFNKIFASKMTSKSTLDLAEQAIQVKCDIHFWMSAFLHVLPHPFFAVTGDDGVFVIPGVPPGNYTLSAWHETIKIPDQKVTLGAGEVKEIDFVVSND